MTKDNCRIGYPKSQAWVLKVLQGSKCDLFTTQTPPFEKVKRHEIATPGTH